MTPVLIEAFFPLPERMEFCQSCEMMLGQADLPDGAPQDRTLDVLPPEWQEEYRQFSKTILALSARFGPAILIKLYDPRSLQGMVKALRYRLRQYPAFVVGGKEKIIGVDFIALETRILVQCANLKPPHPA